MAAEIHLNGRAAASSMTLGCLMGVVDSSLNGVVPPALASDAEAVLAAEPDLAGGVIVSAPSRRFDRGGANLSTALSPVRISLVIPTLNEAENLPHVFERIPDGLHEVIVVDGHSTDETVAVARRLRPDVRIVRQDGRGKGNALAAGFAACTGDIVVTLDADGSADPSEIPRFVAALRNGADFVKGSRFAQGGASSDITLTRKLGNRGLNSLVNALYGTSYTDLCYGYNAFWARCLPYMRVDCDGFEVETLINVRIAKAGLVIHEVPSYERDRIHGRSNLHAVRDGSRVLCTIALERISVASRRSTAARLMRRLLTG
jgi:glycosyltransferase involved in cell wall biosynthesis